MSPWFWVALVLFGVIYTLIVGRIGYGIGCVYTDYRLGPTSADYKRLALGAERIRRNHGGYIGT
jgi:hypothetical protein